MKPLDYTLYNRVKSKFPAQPFTVIFVSLASDNIAELRGQAFTLNTAEELRALADWHEEELIPYATIGVLEEGSPIFDFSCPEFQQEENLRTGKIISSSIETFVRRNVTIDGIQQDLQKMVNGMDLVGNA